MKSFFYVSSVFIFLATTAFSDPGDGPGTADIKLADRTIGVTGLCSDWAFHTVGGTPSLRVEVGEGRNNKELTFNKNASFVNGDAAWFIKDLNTLTQTENGYVLTGMFTNVQASDKPTKALHIEVFCP
ncbi:MAG: hypothetical protein AAF066_05245 [Pseudomonadota bacterium]